MLLLVESPGRVGELLRILFFGYFSLFWFARAILLSSIFINHFNIIQKFEQKLLYLALNCVHWYLDNFCIPMSSTSSSASTYLSDNKRVYWYYCDEHDDRGWGCGWRVMQTISSVLFDEQVTFEEIDAQLVALGNDTKTKDGRLAYADAAWILEYFGKVHPRSTFKQYYPLNFASLASVIEEINSEATGAPKMIVLVCAGMIVCMDAIEQGTSIGHFIDPHVPVQASSMPPLVKPGNGGIGSYCLVQLMRELVRDTLCASVEDEKLREEMEANALEYTAPCFVVITKTE